MTWLAALAVPAMALAFACADKPPATPEQPNPVLGVDKDSQAEVPPPATAIEVTDSDSADAATGQAVEVRGLAQDAKLGAAIVGPDLVVYCEGDDAWPDHLRGQTVIASGTLVRRDTAATVADDGAVSAGTNGPSWFLQDCQAQPSR